MPGHKGFASLTFLLVILLFVAILGSAYYFFKLNPQTKQVPSQNSHNLSSAPTADPSEENLPEIKPLLKKEDFSSAAYTLICPDDLTKIPTSFTWINNLKNKLSANETLSQVCYNQELNQVVFGSEIETDKGGFGAPSQFKTFIKIFNIKSQKVTDVFAGNGNTIAGCGTIKYWTKTNNIYYECSGGEGAGASSLEVVNLQSKQEGTVEKCSWLGNDEFCSEFCTKDSDCRSGSYCYTKANICLQTCTTSNDCTSTTCYKVPENKNACY